jgi:hypothetical protein
MSTPRLDSGCGCLLVLIAAICIGVIAVSS